MHTAATHVRLHVSRLKLLATDTNDGLVANSRLVGWVRPFVHSKTASFSKKENCLVFGNKCF